MMPFNVFQQVCEKHCAMHQFSRKKTHFKGICAVLSRIWKQHNSLVFDANFLGQKCCRCYIFSRFATMHGDDNDDRARPQDLVVPGGALIQLQFPKEPPSHQIQSRKEVMWKTYGCLFRWNSIPIHQHMHCLEYIKLTQNYQNTYMIYQTRFCRDLACPLITFWPSFGAINNQNWTFVCMFAFAKTKNPNVFFYRSWGIGAEGPCL